MSEKKRSSRVLLWVAIAFLAPFLTAVYLRFSGWQPGSTRNFGELLQPPLPMHAVNALQDDGENWVWENQNYRWTLLAVPASPCDQACAEVLEVLPKVRTALARHQHRLPQFVLGQEQVPGELPRLQLSAPPAPLQATPASGAEVWLVDPHGYLVMHYPVGFDPSGLRRDLSRLIK